MKGVRQLLASNPGAVNEQDSVSYITIKINRLVFGVLIQNQVLSCLCCDVLVAVYIPSKIILKYIVEIQKITI